MMMEAQPTPEAERIARARAINERCQRELATYRRQSAAAIQVMLCGLLFLALWAINEAEQHYKRDALVNQEVLAWR